MEFDDSIRSLKSSYLPPNIDVIKNDWDNLKPAKKVNKEAENDYWDSFNENSNRRQSRNNRSTSFVPQPSENNEAFKKFGGAKSISSTQYFGDNQTQVSSIYPTFQEKSLYFFNFSMVILYK